MKDNTVEELTAMIVRDAEGIAEFMLEPDPVEHDRLVFKLDNGKVFYLVRAEFCMIHSGGVA